MTNLVAEANDLALIDDRMRVGCFICTWLLMEYVKSECDEDIKSQGVASKIVVTDSYENPNPNTNSEVPAPTESFEPKNEDGNVDNSDIHPDGVGQDENSEYDFVFEEDDAEQTVLMEILDDAEDVEDVEGLAIQGIAGAAGRAVRLI